MAEQQSNIPNSYIKTQWRNDITPLNAENMNKIEEGIDQNRQLTQINAADITTNANNITANANNITTNANNIKNNSNKISDEINTRRSEDTRVLSESKTYTNNEITGLELSIEKKSNVDYIILKNRSGTEVASINASTFVKDGMLSNAQYNTTTNKLTLTWNTDSGKSNTEIDLNDLVDTYTGGTGITVTSDGSISIDNTVATKTQLDDMNTQLRKLIQQTQGADSYIMFLPQDVDCLESLPEGIYYSDRSITLPVVKNDVTFSDNPKKISLSTNSLILITQNSISKKFYVLTPGDNSISGQVDTGSSPQYYIKESNPAPHILSDDVYLRDIDNSQYNIASSGQDMSFLVKPSLVYDSINLIINDDTTLSLKYNTLFNVYHDSSSVYFSIHNQYPTYNDCYVLGGRLDYSSNNCDLNMVPTNSITTINELDFTAYISSATGSYYVEPYIKFKKYGAICQLSGELSTKQTSLQTRLLFVVNGQIDTTGETYNFLTDMFPSQTYCIAGEVYKTSDGSFVKSCSANMSITSDGYITIRANNVELSQDEAFKFYINIMYVNNIN